MLIGNRVGKAVTVDVEAGGSAMGSYLRVKVKIDICKPLMQGIMVEVGDGDACCLCPFKYEFLSSFCYGCGRLRPWRKIVIPVLRRKKMGSSMATGSE